MENYKVYLKVDREKIAFLNSIIEGYEGMAIQRTIDGKEGIVELISTLDFKKDLEEILRNLKDFLNIEIIKSENF